MKPIPILSLLLLLLAAPYAVAEGPWVPISCEDRTVEIESARGRAGTDGDWRSRWQRYEESVRGAPPGDPRYVPHAYPTSDGQVFEDFLHAFETRLVADRRQVQPRHRKVLEALDSGTLRYEVVRVENWTPGRCRSEHAAPFYHLVRLFDGNHEIARAGIHESGLFAMYAALDGDQGPLEDLSSLDEVVRTRFGVRVRPTAAQFVTTDGLPVRCSPVMPCVAFRSGKNVFLVNHDFYLFALSSDGPRIEIHELAQHIGSDRALSMNAGRRTTPWVSVGYGFEEARLVAAGPRGGRLE